MSKSSGVIHTTSVSRPQLKCYQVKDKVVPNNSQVKFQKKEVEDHHRISSISKKTKSVTACNDSSNSRTSNEMLFVAECGTCVLFNLILFIVDSGMHDEAHDGQNQRCVIVVEKFTGYCSVLKMNQFAPILAKKVHSDKSQFLVPEEGKFASHGLDETPEVLKDFLTMIQRNLQAQVLTVRTDRGTEFLNKTLHAYFKEEGIKHQTSIARTPEQNGVVERQNRTLVEGCFE
ncbi:retrovirus-related pol polyprotein from transposon TNT 1-94 [Tanacetum coccineum]